MDNIYIELQVECDRAGTNLTEICKLTGIARDTPNRWKNKEPNTIQLYRRLLNKIKEVGEQNNEQRTTKQSPE